MTTNLVPIQITLQAANAADAKQLVQDLAGTLSGMPAARIPAETAVSTLPPAEQTQQVAPPAAQAYPAQGYVPTAVPVTQPAPTPVAPPAQVPTAAAPTYDLNQLGVAAQPILDAGRHAELIGWLQQHGAQSLTMLNPSLYGEFATYLRSLGAKI